MKRGDVIAALARDILARKQPSAPLRVAIDGRCAAGKTVLADELAVCVAALRPELQILRPSVDGFHHLRARRYRQGELSARGYYEDAYNYADIVELLLEPLSGTAFPVACRQVSTDVRRDMPLDAPPIQVDANAVLLFEGIFVLRREIDRYWDLRILVDVDAECSIARAVERDHRESPDSSRETVEKKYRLRYEPAWQMYVDAEAPQSRAEVIVDNNDIDDPRCAWRQ